MEVWDNGHGIGRNGWRLLERQGGLRGFKVTLNLPILSRRKSVRTLSWLRYMFPFLRKVPSVPSNAVPSEVINLTWRVKLQSEPSRRFRICAPLGWSIVQFCNLFLYGGFCCHNCVWLHAIFSAPNKFTFRKKKNQDMPYFWISNWKLLLKHI